jgi:hypothetical protein
MNDPQ